MSRRAARIVAHAIRAGAQRHSERTGPGRYEATITAWDGQDRFTLDLLDTDLELDEGDVVLGQTVRKYDADVGLAVDDGLVLLEVGPSDAPDFIAVDVVSDNA